MSGDFVREHTHTKDPNTSYAAARSAPSLAKQHAELILGVIIRSGEPLASHEIEQRCDLAYHQIARRMSDLRKAGRIEDSGQRYTNSNGRQAIRWQPTVEPFRLMP